MHPFSLYTPEDVSRLLAQRLKEARLSLKWKRSTLALRSGVSEASLKRFEQTGQISLDSLLKLAFCLGRLDDVAGLFIPPPAASMEDLERRQERRPKRGSL